MDQKQLLSLRRACKDAAIAILHPGASEGQISIVTEKIYVHAAAAAIGANAVQGQPRDRVNARDTLDALNQNLTSPNYQSDRNRTPSKQ